jgi:pimeloyl-ACP methyl ester carboxylesterase
MSVEFKRTSFRLSIGEKSLEGLLCEPACWKDTILLVHEALGSVSYWKDFPDNLATTTDCRVLAYSRAGHGDSQGPLESRNPKYYRNQVEVVLPALLDRFNIGSPIFYGHSEGAAISLLYAAYRPDQVRAVIAEAPILTPESSSRRRIQELAATYPSSELRSKLARYHKDSDAVFYSWITDATSPQMLHFPLDMYLSKIACPVLVLQGSEDEFGGAVQLLAIQKYLPRAQSEIIVGAAHLPHREMTKVVLEKVRDFLAGISPSVKIEPVTPYSLTHVPE